jgi:hypothetical protein
MCCLLWEPDLRFPPDVFLTRASQTWSSLPYDPAVSSRGLVAHSCPERGLHARGNSYPGLARVVYAFTFQAMVSWRLVDHGDGQQGY